MKPETPFDGLDEQMDRLDKAFDRLPTKTDFLLSMIGFAVAVLVVFIIEAKLGLIAFG